MPTSLTPRRKAEESNTVLLFKVIRLSTPAVIENFITTVVLLTDALMLAQLPNNSIYLASISVASIIYWRVVNLVGCTQIGSSAYISRRWGEGKYSEAGFALGHALLVSLLLGVVAGVAIWPFMPWLFAALSNGDESVTTVGLQYMFILMLAFPVRLVLLTLSGGMRAAGDTRSPLMIMSVLVVLNLFLSYCMIFGNYGIPALGFEGAALSTAISYCVAAILGFWMFKRGLRPSLLLEKQSSPGIPYHSMTSDPLLRLDWMGVRPWFKHITPSIFRVSTSVLGEEILVTIGFLTYIAMVGQFGRDALAAHSATGRIEALSYTTGYGIALATSAMVGQALGARRIRLAEKLFALNSALAATIMGCIGILFILFSEVLLGLFRLDPEVMTIAQGLVVILAIEQIFIGTGMTLSGGLRGAGDTFPPFITQLVGVIGTRLIVGYILAWPLGLGIYGLYWATLLDWMMRTAVYMYFVWKGNWKRIKV
ncbi:MAG: MATE family efflux transporter [Candidatus Sumerlaeia bacterium]|nr:MATE family efflux transporter [Candidatus Sumerlaeia bacterium]